MRTTFVKFFIPALGLFSIFSSCNKIETSKEVYTDSYINTIFNKSGVPVYTILHTAYSYVKMSGVTVAGSSGKAAQLTDYQNTGFSFYNSVDTLAYSLTSPAAENFTYNVTYATNEMVTKSEVVSAKSLLPAQQLDAVKNPSDITLSWKPVANVEAYKVRILTEDLTSHVITVVFESDFLYPKDATSNLTLPFSLTTLSGYLDKKLHFEVSSFIFQVSPDTFQAVSVATVRKYFGA